MRAVVGPLRAVAATTGGRVDTRRACGPLSSVSLNPGATPRGARSSEAADDTAHRLALWLAEVSAEAADSRVAADLAKAQLRAAHPGPVEAPR